MIWKWRNLDLFDNNLNFPINLKKITVDFTKDIVQVERVVDDVFEVEQLVTINIS